MKLGIVGSRSITDNNIIKQILEQYNFDQVVSGGAKGVDSIAEEYGKDIGLDEAIIFRPDYKTYGRAAPFIRNKLIIEASDMVVSIWDGKSTGTNHSMEYARKLKKTMDVWVVTGSSFIKQETGPSLLDFL